MTTKSTEAMPEFKLPPLVNREGQPAEEYAACPDAGIYMARSKLNKKYYVDSSTDLTTRLRQHISSLRRGSYDNQPLLAAAFKKHKPEDVEFRILERFPEFNKDADGHQRAMREREAEWIRRLNPPLNTQRRNNKLNSFDLPHGLPDDLKD